jgi:Leucine-rich repeat (LRR) protein
LTTLAGLEDLVNLEKLWIAHNSIIDIVPLKGLTKLTCLSVFHNNIFHETSFLEIIYQLPDLEDISFEGNPISRDIGVKYKILMNIPTIKHIDDE